jgi:hypothetical protein
MKKRVFILVAEVLFIFMAVGAFLSVSEAGAASMPGTLIVTILNEAANTTPPNRIKVYYDHNSNNIDYLAGTHVGAEICATGGDVFSVDATITGLPAYDGNNSENEFELGKNENATRVLGTIADGECLYAYWYVATPRYKNGGTEVPTTPADGMMGSFTVTANGDDGTLFGPVSASDTSTILMRQAIQAAASQIIQFSSQSVSFYTLTVLYDLGNPGQQLDGVVAPTGWINHDAGVFDMITLTLEVTRVQGMSHIFFGKFDNALYISGLGSNQYIGKATYVFEKVAPGGTVFYPYNIIDSGTQDKYNGDLGDTSIPLAITLRQIKTNTGSSFAILIAVSFIMILTMATLMVYRRKQIHRP